MLANAHLIAAAPEMLAALQAQQVSSDMQGEGRFPPSDDPRYTPFIGEWDGCAAPEKRWYDFQIQRKRLRAAAIAKATGTDP
jgi:hypothetical protein